MRAFFLKYKEKKDFFDARIIKKILTKQKLNKIKIRLMCMKVLNKRFYLKIYRQEKLYEEAEK